MTFESIAPGIWKIRLGMPESHTPIRHRLTAADEPGLATLPNVDGCPIDAASIAHESATRGFHVAIPLGEDEQIYGLGLQLKSFNQRSKKKTLRVNSDPIADLGDSHAPAPVYFSTAGYGVFIDTARYATFYFGCVKRHAGPATRSAAPSQAGAGESLATGDDNRPLYLAQTGSAVEIEIPYAEGVDIYVFGGPALIDAVCRYNLYSGGGPIPPRWGLGVWYRAESKMTDSEVIELAHELRESQMPCDVIGLEPGWQTASYSCSYVWSERFPDPKAFISKLREDGFRVNLWEHAFTAPTSPIYEKLLPYAGSYEIWGGIAPDLSFAQARETFADFHSRSHVDAGVSGYKLDECDNSDFLGSPWSFPEFARYPSGMDGELFHSLFGMLYQDTLHRIFETKKVRTYGAVRNTYALCAPYPFVLYSDLYDHADFIRGMVNAGFCGMLWTPEVRDASSEEDLIRRLQSTVLSPMALINAWYIRRPPWKQWRTKENNDGQFLRDYEAVQDRCRRILELRMQLVPYLYAAYVAYREKGTPPFRALVMDYPSDPGVFHVDNQWMVGDRLMCAPITAKETSREVYLPEGVWRDFWTGESIHGGATITVTPSLDRIPIYVKDGSVLPLAEVAQSAEDPRGLELHVRVYGDGSLPCTLYEDDGVSTNYSDRNVVTIAWPGASGTGIVEKVGNYRGAGYRVVGWTHI